MVPERQFDKAGGSSTVLRPDRHMAGLDVVRGAAIVAVLLYHGMYTPALWSRAALGSSWYSWIATPTQFGYLGVNLFFVLSGFLITGILLDTKTDAGYFRSFYLRRVVRIVPAYLLMIVVLKLLHQISWRFVLVSLLYLCNMGHSFQAQSYPPFWSLSVEEQFYLVWPFLVFKLKPRTVFFLCLGIIVASPGLRFALLHLPHGFADIDYKTWSIADFFAGGACISLCIRSNRLKPHLWRICLSMMGVALAGFLLVWAPSTSAVVSRAGKAFYYSPWVFFFSSVILFAYLRPGLAGSLAGRCLVFLGYISYGLYLCHSLIMTLCERRWTLSERSGGTLAGYLFLRFALECALAIGIAWLSRATFEAFFLRMKPGQRKVPRDLRLNWPGKRSLPRGTLSNAE